MCVCKECIDMQCPFIFTLAGASVGASSGAFERQEEKTAAPSPHDSTG